MNESRREAQNRKVILMKMIATLIVGAFVSTAVLAAEKAAAPTAAEKGLCTVINSDGTKTQSETTKTECKGTFEVSQATTKEKKK